MFCKNCGAELPDNTHFCTNCGFDQTAPYTPYANFGRMNDDFDRKPSSNLALAVIVTVLCCIPFGIISIIYASKVDSAWTVGRHEEARMYSRKARNWAIWGAALTLLFYVVYIILIVAGVSWAMWWDEPDTFFTGLL